MVERLDDDDKMEISDEVGTNTNGSLGLEGLDIEL